MIGTHTPGPWTANICWVHGKPTGFHIADQKRGSTNPIAFTSTITAAAYSAEELQGNALLMGTAPDLLAACQAFIAARTNQELHEALTKAQAAVAKATGE